MGYGWFSASASLSATNTLPSGPYQAGIWCPHQSWREMHQGWMFSIQLKYVASQLRGTKTVRPSRTAAIAGCANVLGVDIPLIGQKGFDDDTPNDRRAAPYGCAARSWRGDRGLHPGDDLLSHGETVEAMVGQGFSSSGEPGTSRRNASLPRKIELGLDIEHVDQRQIVTPADLEIVEVMRRRDLHRAGALLRIGIFIGDDWNTPADQRQDPRACRRDAVALILGMHRDRGIAEHGFRPRGRDGDEARRTPRRDI